MAKEKELKDLFLDTLKDIYFAEKKILSSLPKMAKAAQSAKLKAAFEKHQAETEGQVDRLEQVFALDRRDAEGQDLRRHHRHPRRGQGNHVGVQGHRPRSMPACSRRHRRSSTTKSPATAR